MSAVGVDRARVRAKTVVPPSLPALVAGHVTHQRTSPIRHGFRHPTYQWLVDLDALPVLPRWLRPVASFRSADHLGVPERSIRANVEHFLRLHDIDLGAGGRIVMLANARSLGHVFNPLSVFWCFDGRGRVEAVIAEVHNTYGERHAYLLRPDPAGTAHVDKGFHVSPFFDESGSYELRFTLSVDAVATTVLLRRGGAPAFSATFRGRPQLATPASVAMRVLRQPFLTYRISASIRLHGIWLWLRRLPLHTRPEHVSQEGV